MATKYTIEGHEANWGEFLGCLNTGDFECRITDDGTQNLICTMARTISDLKQNLSDTDYVILKISEAETDEEKQAIRTEYADVIAQRKQWRARINELQNICNANS